jgi:hypothetical protein
MPRRSPRPVARCLCAGCGLRFSSTSAFDAHRIFAPRHKGDWGTRRCLAPSKSEGFESTEGICRITGETIEGVAIWGLTDDRARARAAFRSRHRQAEESAARASQSNVRNAGRPRRPKTANSPPRKQRPSELRAATGAKP